MDDSESGIKSCDDNDVFGITPSNPSGSPFETISLYVGTKSLVTK